MCLQAAWLTWCIQVTRWLVSTIVSDKFASMLRQSPNLVHEHELSIPQKKRLCLGNKTCENEFSKGDSVCRMLQF